MQGLPVSFATRTENPDGKTSPEELIAAAHASCYAMALSNALGEQGNDPEELKVTATCVLDMGSLKITTVVLDVSGRVPGLDEEGFRSAAEQAEQVCPVSNALRGNVDIQLNASLDLSGFGVGAIREAGAPSPKVSAPSGRRPCLPEAFATTPVVLVLDPPHEPVDLGVGGSKSSPRCCSPAPTSFSVSERWTCLWHAGDRGTVWRSSSLAKRVFTPLLV